jgi:hypothetical protein
MIDTAYDGKLPSEDAQFIASAELEELQDELESYRHVRVSPKDASPFDVEYVRALATEILRRGSKSLMSVSSVLNRELISGKVPA